MQQSEVGTLLVEAEDPRPRDCAVDHLGQRLIVALAVRDFSGGLGQALLLELDLAPERRDVGFEPLVLFFGNYNVDVPTGSMGVSAQGGWLCDPPPHVPIRGTEGVRLHVGSSVQRTIAFIGVPHAGSAGGIHCTGTAFLVLYKGHGYLVTARHCVEDYENREYLIRVNKGDRASTLLVADKGTRWRYHDDPTIDVAVLPVVLSREHGFDCLHISEDAF